MDAPGTPITGTDTHAVLRTDSGNTLIDASGTELWELPAESASDAGISTITLDDEAVYMMTGEDHSVVALDLASGEEKWRYEPSTLHECVPAHAFDLETDPRSPDVLVVTFEHQHTKPEDLPSSCREGATADWPYVPHLVSLDRDTGEALYEPIKYHLIANSLNSRFDITGRYYDRLYNERGGAIITRTDVHTGETRSVDVRLHTFGSAEWLTDAGDNTFYIRTGEGAAYDQVIVDRWADHWKEGSNAEYDSGEVSTYPVAHDPDCSVARPISTTGYTYCSPHAIFDGDDFTPYSALLGDPTGEEIVTYTDDGAEPGAWEATGWEYEHILNLFNTDDTAGNHWDPVVPEDEAGPALVVLPITDNALRAFDIRTGEILWTSEPDDENPPMGAHYVPGVDEVLVASNGHLRALDARTGEQKWEDTNLGGRMFRTHGLALSAPSLNGGPDQLRLVENAAQ